MKQENISMISQNEREANIFVAKAMRITAAALTVILILNILGIFVIKMQAMIISYVSGMVILFIPTLLVNIMKKYHLSFKYIFVTIAVLFVSIMIVTLNWHAQVVFIFAIGIASMYFTKKVNIYAIIASVVAFSVSQVFAYQLGFTIDDNQDDLYGVVIFCILPRALSLFAMSALFLSLNNRTRKLLENLMDADAQTKMVDRMKHMQEKSLEVSGALVDTVTVLSEVTTNTGRNNRQISEKSEIAGDGSGQTMRQLEEVGSSIANISQNLTKLAGGTGDITQISNEVHKLTADNENNMVMAMEGFQKIRESTERSRQVINELEQKSQQIADITQVITKISSKTNLLALNASIESARAGEAGKGFAVVADQIRELAEQTKEAVGDISAIIGEVVESTLCAVESMDENSQLVINGMEIIQNAGESSKQVAAATEEMGIRIGDIDIVTKEVANDSEKIVTIVENVEEISTQSVNELREVQEASALALADMERLEQLVIRIKDMSGKLDEVVHGAI